MDINNIYVKDILYIATVPSPKGRIETMYNRSSYGLSFTTDGQITYTQNGKSFVQDKDHAVILPKGQSYTIRGNKTGSFPVINFDCDVFFTDTIIVLPVSNTNSILKDFEHLKHLFFQQKNRFLMLSIFYNILHKIIQSENPSTNQLTPALEYIEGNYHHNITNAVLAEKCLMGEDYFRKQFKKHFGISPKQYLIDIRINTAKQMLTDGTMKITVISELCGFTNPYHFCRLFKQRTSMTPSEFINQHKIRKI